MELQSRLKDIKTNMIEIERLEDMKVNCMKVETEETEESSIFDVFTKMINIAKELKNNESNQFTKKNEEELEEFKVKL